MVPLITIYLLIELVLAANITKFTEGGYVTLIIALLISVMFIWYSAKINKSYTKIVKLNDYKT
jgi:KUP system potassium uptake protein